MEALAAVLLTTALACRVGTTEPEPAAAATIRVPATTPVDAGAPAAPVGRLQEVLDGLTGPARVELGPGEHRLDATELTEATCANCEDPDTEVVATRGLLVRGRGVAIVGAGAERTTLVTQAGYGLLFEGCDDCGLEGVTVTGGRRDSDPNASNAAVVVKGGRVSIRDATLRDNVGDPEVVRHAVVGIMGVAARDGADVTIERCRISRNSWDGVAVFRDSRATIRDNVIDGVDRAVGAQVGGGRGVGIGLTWNARAEVVGNLVRRYWKGVGIFVDAEATVRRNVIEDVATWGIAVWDAGRGRPRATVEGNVVFASGACGAVVTLPADDAKPGEDGAGGENEPSTLRGNVFVLTGQDPRQDPPDRYCEQVALHLASVPRDFVVGGNVFHANREADGLPGREDVDLGTLRVATEPLLATLRELPALRESRFLTTFGAR